MLYDLWCRIARAHPDQLALYESAGARGWTFGELFAAVQNAPKTAEPVVFPQGASADFLVCVLRAWRDGRAVCPLEPGQIPPEIAGCLPSDIVHLKMTSA